MNGYGLICSEGERWNVQRRFTLDFMRKYGMSKLNQIQNSTLEEKIHQCLDILMEGMCLHSSEFSAFLCHSDFT